MVVHVIGPDDLVNVPIILGDSSADVPHVVCMSACLPWWVFPKSLDRYVAASRFSSLLGRLVASA
jgi:hypothetical protein